MIGKAGVLTVIMTALAATGSPPLAASVSPNQPVCPPGHSAIQTSVGALCVHDVADPVPDAPRSRTALAAQPRCYGDGVSGNRVQLLYVYERGTGLRPGITDRIVRKYVPRIEGLVRGRSREQGQELGVRFHMPGCKLRIDLVELPASVVQPRRGDDEQAARIIDELAARGFDSSDRKYLAWIDAPSSKTGAGPCGIGTLGAMGSGPFPNPFDQPTSTNYHNGIQPGYALAFASAIRIPARFGAWTPCWGAGSSGAEVEAHELFHTLGAVQLSAPNSNGIGHCTDGPDLMCYQQEDIEVRNVCTYTKAKVLDCEGDDYFNVNPAPGSYLSTHWNTARSSFLGSALTDGVPINVRRP
jgi:hypothetical protein